MTDDKHCKECGEELTAFEIATASLHAKSPMAGLCGDCKFKYTEEKHGSAQAELDRIREKGRERRWRFMEKSKAEGKRQFSAIISKEAYDTMCGIRDAAQLKGKPTSFGEIIEKALVCYNETINVSSHEITNKSERKPEPDQTTKEPSKQIRETQTEIPAPTPDKVRIIERMTKYRAAGDLWQTVADKLNDQGILTARGETWTKANAQAFYSRNKEA